MKIRYYILILLIMWGTAGSLTFYGKNFSLFKSESAQSEEYYGGLEVIRVEGGYAKIDERINFPNLTATAYLVADIDTGEIIESKDADIVYPIASLTKMMTAVVSVDTIDQYSPINITKQAVDTYGSQGKLRRQEILSANELLFPLLLESSNDAAEALAIFAGRDSFIKNMNSKAISIGMSNTSFYDASGLSALNKSTANDLLTLTNYINKNYPELINITKKKDYKLGKRVWRNNSRFINDKNYMGGKNGYTDEAKLTIISIFDLPLSDNSNKKIAIIVLQSKKIEKDVRDILFYLLRNIEHKKS